MDEISYSGDRPRRTRHLSKRGILFLVFFAAILALIGGVLFFVSKKNLNKPRKVIKIENTTTTATPTQTPTPKESPTPTISLKKSSLKISIQNGSGEAGVAGDAAKILKDAGYSVVSTGNADNFGYKGITIRIKKSKNSFISDLIKDLSSQYNVSSSDATSDLDEKESFDALVIVGK